MMGIGFGWVSSEQMRRVHDVATELAATRERLAEQAVHVERRRIAAELHDLVGHSLTVVLLSVTGARRQVGDDPDAAIQALREAEAIGRASLAEIRRSARALRDGQTTGADFAPMPAASDVPELVERMASAGSPVDLRITGDIDELGPVTGLVVYRVVQESLNNAARHAPGAATRVVVAVGGEAVDVEVVDAGGAGPPPGAGRGGSGRDAGAGGGGGGQARRRPDRRGLAGAGPRAPHRGRPAVIAVILVDDQPLVRAGLQRILSEDEGFTVVAECGDGATAVAAIRAAAADVVVMDVPMRGMDGIEATRQIRALDGPPVLVLTTFDDDEVLWGAIEAGAAGFVLKEASAEDLIAATRTVASGGAWLDPAVTARVLEVTRSTGLPRQRQADKATLLTDRELDVLRHMATGATNGEIAGALFVSEATVKTHVGSVFSKLGVRDRAGAIVFAYQHGLVPS